MAGEEPMAATRMKDSTHERAPGDPGGFRVRPAGCTAVFGLRWGPAQSPDPVREGAVRESMPLLRTRDVSHRSGSLSPGRRIDEEVVPGAARHDGLWIREARIGRVAGSLKYYVTLPLITMPKKSGKKAAKKKKR